MVTRYLFYSHDGYGLGHARRNSLIARAVLEADSTSQVSLVTGIAARPRWLRESARVRVHRVPPMVKAADGSYRHERLSFEEAVRERERVVTAVVERERPHVVVVDRHPYGTGGELRPGLEAARRQGAALVLGLRDVLDDPPIVQEELGGLGWDGVDELYDEVLVYGSPEFVDHEAEYGLSVTPSYCGWVVEHPEPSRADRNLLVVAAGGGGDGAAVFEVGARVLGRLSDLHGVFAAGPYIDVEALTGLNGLVPVRARVVRPADSCGRWFSRAGAVLCMAGYNSTLEALAAGQRPILMPRRRPRREQAIRAERFADLGLADVIDASADATGLAALLERPRTLDAGALDAARIDLGGAANAARRLLALSSAWSAP